MELATLLSKGVTDPIDIFKEIKRGRLSTTASHLDFETTNKINGSPLDLTWLPFGAKAYNLSPNIKDYILVPVFVIPASIPNRNTIGFLLEDLVKFNIEHGMQHYKTWRGKPTFYEHKNDNPVEANGIILDTMMKKSTKGNYWKVFNYMAFDRTKYSDLIQRVVRKEVSTYSMGATISGYDCSICGREVGKCVHQKLNDTNIKLIDTGLDHPEVAFKVGRNPIGFETSIVEDPAWIVADNDYVQFLAEN